MDNQNMTYPELRDLFVELTAVPTGPAALPAPLLFICFVLWGSSR